MFNRASVPVWVNARQSAGPAKRPGKITLILRSQKIHFFGDGLEHFYTLKIGLLVKIALHKLCLKYQGARDVTF